MLDSIIAAITVLPVLAVTVVTVRRSIKMENLRKHYESIVGLYDFDIIPNIE